MQRVVALIYIGALACLLSGCFPDKNEGYKAVYDRKGELVPHDPTARTYEKIPDPNSKTLVPVKTPTKTEEKEQPSSEEEKQPEEEDKDQPPTPPEVYFGIPVYPQARYAEGHAGMTTSTNMKQVFLETFDIPEMVDSFYITKLPLDARKVEKTAKGKTYLYTFPVFGHEIRTVQIMPADKRTHIIITSLEDPTLGGIANSAPPRLPASSSSQPSITTRPLSPLPAMPTATQKGGNRRP
jgi:hypothetical protein